MEEERKTGRLFADEKYSSGIWQSRRVAFTFRPARLCAGMMSFKRKEVDALARMSDPAHLVLDLGAGSGAYAHWFLAAGRASAVVALDWSFSGLSVIPKPRRGRILRVCADASMLPFKPGVFHAAYSVDVLGHLPSITAALDELIRTLRPGAPLFLHSECGSYKRRWPDTMLNKRIGRDFLAEYDGHVSLFTREELRTLFTRRFLVERCYSPAGLLGWLTGYPEKYRLAFKEAGCRNLAALCAVFARIKSLPLTGLLLRVVNSAGNHLELMLGLEGGGSFFARLYAPEPGPGRNDSGSSL